MKNLPTLPMDLNPTDIVDFLKQIDEERKFLEVMNSSHIRWYTHKNPYGCWICEYAQFVLNLINDITYILNMTGHIDTHITGDETIKY